MGVRVDVVEEVELKAGYLTKHPSLWGRSITKQWAFYSTPPMIASASPKSHWAWPGGWDRGTNISWDRRRCSLT